MQTKDFDYHLPPELIAQQPAAERTQARLMLVDRATGELGHYHASDLPALLKPGDLVVLNNTRVIPARVFGRKQKTGGRVEVLFIAEREHKDLKKVGRGVSARFGGALGEAWAEPSEGAAHPEGFALPSKINKVVDRKAAFSCNQIHDHGGRTCGEPIAERLGPASPSIGMNFSVRCGGSYVRTERSKEVEPVFWEAFLHSSGRPRAGDLLELANGEIRALVKSTYEYGRVMLEVSCAKDFSTVLEEEGLPPLPPYIKRPKNEPTTDSGRLQRKHDYERYQTVYAKVPGAIAAPTAGLHFTEALLAGLRAKGIQLAEITLHVGPGTFIPVKSERVEDHVMEPERYVIEEPAAGAINAALAEKRRIVAVGTTVARALEAAASGEGKVKAGSGATNLFIYPPYCFKVVRALLTNFHLPRSTLLMLVSAFVERAAGNLAGADPPAALRAAMWAGSPPRRTGIELIRRAYETAVREKYRFYSYGDCMLIG